MKRNASVPRRRRSLSRFVRHESLETRALLTASGLELAMAHAEPQQPASEVSTLTLDSESGGALRIVNGTQTSDFEAVGIVNNGCSGTLIAPGAVLTAAHCVPSNPNETQTFDIEGKTYTVKESFIHPEYASRDIDIAILILNEDVTGVEPIDINRVAPSVGQMLTLVGYGGTGTAQGGHNGDFGVKHVGQTPIDEVTPTHINWNFDNASEANTAPGDSGGPAFIEVNGQIVVAGVTSGGTQENAALGDFSFDTRVDSFASWIDGIVAGEGSNSGGGGQDPSTDPDEPDVPVDPGAGDAESLAREELSEFDVDGDGKLSSAELTAEFESFGYTSAEASEEAAWLLADFDQNDSGDLDLAELTASYGGDLSPGDGGGDEPPVDVVDPPVDDPIDPIDPIDDPVGDPIDDPFPGGGDANLTPQQLAAEELAAYDVDSSGTLSLTELTNEFLDYGDTPADASMYASDLMQSFDSDGDGELNADELAASYRDADEGFGPAPDDGFDPIDDDFGPVPDDGMDPVDDMPVDPVDDEVLPPMQDDNDDFHCDVNGDGTESAIDALMILNYLFLGDDLGPDGMSNYDINGDGAVSPIDALRVINRLADLSWQGAGQVNFDKVDDAFVDDDDWI